MTFRPHRVRWPALLMFVSVIGLLLTACQEKTGVQWATVAVSPARHTPTPEKTSPIPATLAVTPTPNRLSQSTLDSALRGQTIEFWHPWQGDLVKRAEEAASEFNRTNPWGLTVKVRPFYSSSALEDAVTEGLANKSLSGKPDGLPQVVAAPSEQLAAWSEQAGMVTALDEYVTHPQYGLSEAEVKAFYPVFWAQDEVNGKRVGIPALRSARLIFYNETWAKELGFSSSPQTPQGFKDQACAAAKKNNASGILEKYGTGGWMIDNDALTTLSWLGVFGSQPIPKTDGEPYTFQSKPAEKTLAFLRGMLDEGCAWLPRTPEPYEYFSRRMSLFYIGTLPDVYVQARWQEQLKSKDHWVAFPFPSEDGKPVVYSGGYSYAVFQSKPEIQMAAWLFVRWMEQPDVAAKLTAALPSIPVSESITAKFKDTKNTFPWEVILPLAEVVRPAPALPSWLETHRLVEDASYQVYRLPAEELLQILPQLDQAIREMAARH